MFNDRKYRSLTLHSSVIIREMPSEADLSRLIIMTSVYGKCIGDPSLLETGDKQCAGAWGPSSVYVCP